MLGSCNHLATQFVGNKVETVTDAKHGQPKREHAFIGWWSILIVDGRRSPARNDASRPIAFYFFKRGRARQDNGKYFKFADAARNELCILRTEVENDDGLVFHEQFSLIPGRV